MSIQKRGDGYRVRWRDASGKQHSQQVDDWAGAQALDTDKRRKKQLGHDLSRDLDRIGLTLRAFVADGFRSHADLLAPSTRQHYAWALDHHLTDLLDEQLIAIDVPRLMDLQRQLLQTGRTPSTIGSALTRLSGILTAAVERGHIPHNPVRGLRRVAVPATDEVQPLQAVQLETIVDRFDGRSRAIVVLCGHLGLRPLEARLALWSDYEGATLTIDRTRTKKGAARTRVIAVPATTQRELNAWRLQSGGRGDEPIIGPLTASGLASWGEDHFKPLALEVTGRSDVSLYTLRHTHASALHYCGWTVPDAAARMGHSGIVHLRTYAHPMAQLSARRWPDVDSLIADARAEACPDCARKIEKG